VFERPRSLGLRTIDGESNDSIRHSSADDQPTDRLGVVILADPLDTATGALTIATVFTGVGVVTATVSSLVVVVAVAVVVVAVAVVVVAVAVIVVAVAVIVVAVTAAVVVVAAAVVAATVVVAVVVVVVGRSEGSTKRGGLLLEVLNALLDVGVGVGAGGAASAEGGVEVVAEGRLRIERLLVRMRVGATCDEIVYGAESAAERLIVRSQHRS